MRFDNMMIVRRPEHRTRVDLLADPSHFIAGSSGGGAARRRYIIGALLECWKAPSIAKIEGLSLPHDGSRPLAKIVTEYAAVGFAAGRT